MENIGEKIRQIRLLKGRKQEDVAFDLCITQKSLSNIETGKTIPGIPRLEQIAKVFDMTLIELLHFNIENTIFKSVKNETPDSINQRPETYERIIMEKDKEITELRKRLKNPGH